MSIDVPFSGVPLSQVQIPEEQCRAFAGPVELVGKRWSGAILLAGRLGAERFGDYRHSVPGISDRLLSQRLKELEAERLVVRTVVPTTPVQILYRLTEAGQELVDALQPLAAWGHKWRPSGTFTA